ncbi:MAG: mechanosensitive ion channel family protein [Planctomycetes bacterium]|nr:mechanosensitive ion channel family protein [Planctomycetota bacterium]
MTWQEYWAEWSRRLALDRAFYGNSTQQWLIALAIFIGGIILFPIIQAILVRRLAKLAERWESIWDDSAVEAFRNTRFWFLLVLALYLGTLVLVLPVKVRDLVEAAAILALLAQAAVWGNVAINVGLEKYSKRQREKDPAAVTTMSAVSFIGKLALFSVLLLLALDNVGIDVTALIAGLGIGGIAVALAAQNILGDLFASLSIVLDKPFVLGDFIIVGDFLGSVEKIGLKTTRLRSLSGEQLVISNNDLLQSRIRNYKRMVERRIVFSLGVTYDTPREMLSAIPGMVREIIEAQSDVRFDRAHFKEFGAYSLNFEVVYYILSGDFNLYMDRQQAINLAIYDRFTEQQIEFAFPTQTLLLEKPGGGSGRPAD